MNEEVAILGHYPPPVTGERLCCVYLADRLSAQGYRVRTMTKLAGSLRPIRADAVWVVLGSSVGGFIRDCWIVWRLRHVTHLYLYIHNFSWSRMARVSRWLPRKISARLTCVVLTEFIVQKLTERGLRAVLLRNTLTDRALDNLLAPVGVKRLVWMSAINAEKGFHLAYEAFILLRQHDQRWEFDVYGTGLSAQRFPLARFHGLATGIVKREAFAKGGILLLPSAYVNETQPLCIVEALSVGMPVVASCMGGIPEMLGCGDEAAGICVARPAAESICAAIMAIHRSAAQFQEQAVARYKKAYSREAFDRELQWIVSECRAYSELSTYCEGERGEAL